MKEWIDANDPGAAVIPFSGILENKLISMSTEDKQRFLEENKTQRYATLVLYSFGYITKLLLT